MTDAPSGGVPGDAEKALYLAVLQSGGRIPVREATAQDPAATARLLELGLLVHQDADGTLTAADPRTAGGRLGRALRETATRRFAQAEQAVAELDDLAAAYDSAVRRGDRSHPITHLQDADRIRHRLQRIQAGFREELLAALPGPRPAAHLPNHVGTEQVPAAGARTDLLLQPIGAADPDTAEYAARTANRSLRLRSLDEDFTRMLIFDRKVAIISASTDNRTTAFIEDPAVVDHLVALFQRDWARADRATGTAAPVVEQIARLLAQGLTQRAVATRLNLSERTIAEHIARLRERHDAGTQFQLGWLMRGSTR